MSSPSAGTAGCVTLTGMIGVDELSDRLGVDPGDVRVLLAQLGGHADTVNDTIGAEIRDKLNHVGERTVPGL